MISSNQDHKQTRRLFQFTKARSFFSFCDRAAYLSFIENTKARSLSHINVGTHTHTPRYEVKNIIENDARIWQARPEMQVLSVCYLILVIVHC
jgi:hypothetical protein